MAKEIGGYMELEHFHGKEMYPDLYKVNLGRTALVWLLQRIEHRRVFIPAYICESVIDSAAHAGFDVVLYGLDEELEPVWGPEGAPEPDDILYLVNYYGQLAQERIERCRDEFSCVIVDNAQAFYDRPVDGVHTIYTARKFFGLSDGAYIATDIDTAHDDITTDSSAGRMKHLIGRLEGSARDYYSEMLAVSDTFGTEIPRRMSPLTENLLKGIDYEYVRNRRRDNYHTLSRLLPDDNPFNRLMPECPWSYPYHHENGPELRKFLASRSIFVPTNWSYLLKKMPEGTLEHDWAADILPLPVDQRYSEEEMNIIAKAIREF